MQTGLVAVELADRSDELAPVTTSGCALGRLRVAPLEPGPHALVVAVGEAFGEISSLLVEPRKKTRESLVDYRYSLRAKMACTRSTIKRGCATAAPGTTMTVGLAVHTPTFSGGVGWVRKPMQRREVSAAWATLLDKTLKRELPIGDRSYIVTMSPLTLKLTPKGKRKGMELQWGSARQRRRRARGGPQCFGWQVDGGYNPCRADQTAAASRPELTLAAGSPASPMAMARCEANDHELARPRRSRLAASLSLFILLSLAPLVILSIAIAALAFGRFRLFRELGRQPRFHRHKLRRQRWSRAARHGVSAALRSAIR